LTWFYVDLKTTQIIIKKNPTLISGKGLTGNQKNERKWEQERQALRVVNVSQNLRAEK
jgi:predicted acetyltransferase